MDYVPDIAAFKELNFHGGDTYVCTVRSCPGSAAVLSRKS